MKKPYFKTRIGWSTGTPGCTAVTTKKHSVDRYSVRVTDARELTAEQAIADTITRNVHLDGDGPLDSAHVPEGYTATVRNGKVIVRKIRRNEQ